MGPNSILPLLLMNDDSANEDLLFMMMMNQNKPDQCEPASVNQPVEKSKPVETVYRTWRVNDDGTKELISESSGN